MALNIGENIKKVREAKGLSQKQVITAIEMGAAQYSRIESGKTEPSLSTLQRIAQALGVPLPELFTDRKTPSQVNPAPEVNAYDKSLMEKLRLIESLSEEEKRTLYTILDAFVGKRRLKETLSGLLQQVA